MDTHPPNFLIEFGRITRAIFFNIGGQPPPLAPLAGATDRKASKVSKIVHESSDNRTTSKLKHQSCFANINGITSRTIN